MERLTNIYFRFGFWIHAVGLGTALISWSFVDSYWGVALVAIGSLLAVSDPVVLLGIKRERQPERTYLIAYGLALLAVLLYVVRVALDVPLDKSGDGTPLIVRLRSLLLVLFFVSFSAGLLLRLGLMLGYSSRRSVTESLARIRQQSLARAVTSLVGALLFLVVVNYGTSLRNPSWDLTPGYFSFGSEARTLVRSLDRTVEVIAFLPAQQMVRNRKSGVTPPELFLVAEDVRGMLEQLPLINNRISLDFRNADLGLIDLTEFGSVNNGTIVLRVRKTGAAAADDKPYVERRVHVYNEKDLEKFEKEIVRALIQVSSPSKVMYFTASNGERYDFTDNARKLEGLSELQEAMRFYNLSIRRLDHQQNWPPKVPDDADALVIAGPAVPFSDDARAAVVEYLKKDGRVFISIDPAGKEHFGWLFAAMQGKQYTYSNEPLSFRYPDIVITDSIPEHRITESVALRADRIMVLPQTGRFEEARGDAKGAPGPFERVLNFKSTAIIHSAPGTVVDLNRNGKKDGAELTGRYTLGLAFEPAAPMAKPQQGKPVPPSRKVPVVHRAKANLTNRPYPKSVRLHLPKPNRPENLRQNQKPISRKPASPVVRGSWCLREPIG